MAGDIDYLDASFRGVPFRIKTSSDTFGRRGESYEYPNSETPGYLDLGRKAQKYKITGYAYGDDHLAQAQAMVNACEQPDPGALIHPFLGGILVACVSLEVSNEYIEKKRVSAYSFEFLEPGLDTTAASPFGNIFDGLLSLFPEVTANLSQIVDTVISTSGLLDEFVVSEIQRSSQLIYQGLSGLDDSRYYETFGRLERVASIPSVTRSEPFGRLFQDAMSSISDSGPRKTSAKDSFGRLIAVSDGLKKNVPENSGLTRPLNALYSTTRIGAVLNASLVTRGIEYDTLFEALSDLDKMVRVLDSEAYIASRSGDNLLYAQIVKVRGYLIQDMIKTNIGKPGIILRTRAGQFPSLVLAYDIYGDAKRATELERYNPGFSPFALGEKVWGASR